MEPASHRLAPRTDHAQHVAHPAPGRRREGTMSMRGMALGALLLVACAPPERDLTSTEQALVTASRSFGWRLLKAAADGTPDQNVVVAPLSVSLALGMTANGANGETRAAMARVLEIDALTPDQANASYRSLIDYLLPLDPKVQFALANAIWHRTGFTPKGTFLDVNQRFFDADVRGLDFSTDAAVTTMNDWVKAKTAGRIDAIVSAPIDPNTVMFLMNALYFKGDWTDGFDAAKTSPRPFALASGPVNVPTMSGRIKGARLSGSASHNTLELPFGDGRFSMVFIVPTGATIDVFPDSTPWQAAITSLRDVAELDVFVPRFTLKSGLDLKGPLTTLGMGVAFSDVSADFTGIADQPHLYVDRVMHKSFVEVTETGAEAAAATSVEMSTKSVSMGPETFAVDRPFLFAIRERANDSLLFVGRVLDPR
jgi:serpin B